MNNGSHSNGHHPNGNRDGGSTENVHLNIPDRTEETMYGVSQIGIHDLVPQMGYREYWYPAIEVRKLGRKPRRVKLLGDELVMFRGKDGKVGALKDRCPHRGAFLSYGKCEFEGTISCPYHGYTFDETGKCVAAITEGPDSPMVGKLKARAYPTAVLGGVAYVWMGQTDPVPLEEDLPSEFFDSKYAVHVYSKMWPMNWAVSIEQNEDAHFSWIHRFRVRRLFNLEAFRQIPAYWSGMNVVGETDSTMGIKPTVNAAQQAYYPGLGKKWPQHVWWRFRKFPVPGINVKSFSGKPYRSEHYLPSITRVDMGNRMYNRWAVPVDENHTMMFTYDIRKGGSLWDRIFAKLCFHTVVRYWQVKGVNELEDLPVQLYTRMDPKEPQKLGRNDRAIIHWRRKMPLKSRDAQRVWGMSERALVEADAVREEREGMVEVGDDD